MTREKSSKPRKTHYHSTVSRRDFMKMLGLGAASVVGAVANPLPLRKEFADLDEVKSSPLAKKTQPFWVKEVDKPTVEIDWERMERFDARKFLWMSGRKRVGEEGWAEIFGNQMRIAKEGALNDTPSYSLRDRMMFEAGNAGWKEHTPSWNGFISDKYLTHKELGVPKYEGTPEENAQMVRAALRIFGASEAGFAHLTREHRKMIYSYHAFGQEIVFENVQEPYMDETKRVIPDRDDLTVITYTIPQSLYLTQAGHNGGFGGAVPQAYAMANYVTSRLATFLRGLGYITVCGDTYNFGPTTGWGVLAGLGEYTRAVHLSSPKYGLALRMTMLLLTDLPLAETKPIDAGIWKFCQTCKKCAEGCPAGAISMADQPSYEVTGDWNNPGVNGYALNALECWKNAVSAMPYCNYCQASCPFNKMDKAVLHELVRLTIGTTPAFNSIIRKMDDVMGYGIKEERAVDFWKMDPEDIPLFGLDPSRS